MGTVTAASEEQPVSVNVEHWEMDRGNKEKGEEYGRLQESGRT